MGCIFIYCDYNTFLWSRLRVNNILEYLTEQYLALSYLQFLNFDNTGTTENILNENMKLLLNNIKLSIEIINVSVGFLLKQKEVNVKNKYR